MALALRRLRPAGRRDVWRWDCEGGAAIPAPGNTAPALGFPSGCGQPLYVGDLFLAIAHPGADNFTTAKGVCCRLAAHDEITADTPVNCASSSSAPVRPALRVARWGISTRRGRSARTWSFWSTIGIGETRAIRLRRCAAFVRIKQETGVPLDSFTLDDGWDLDWDEATGLWGRLGRKRFPGGWESLQSAAARPESACRFGSVRSAAMVGAKQRVAFARTRGFEINGDKLCLAGPRYQKHVMECFSQWAALGMDYIKVDGFWPDCAQTNHRHAVGRGGAIQQMDALIGVFAAWRKANPKLVIGYTSGSNPSPFWLQHCDYVWRSGADDEHEGAGDPFDRYHTFVDGCLQVHRSTEMPISGFVTFDIVQGRTRSSSRAAFERGAWWLAARTSLHHDWYVEAGDLTAEEWRLLAARRNGRKRMRGSSGSAG